MLTTSRVNPELDELLIMAASILDIPDHIYEDATLKYEDVGNWLGSEDSELLNHTPDIYVQGSFRLGTVVRPISEKDEYDIDLVCHLNIDKENVTQKDLKEMVGMRLKKRKDLAGILKPSRRCWTLEYQSGNQMQNFHMDILPAIPNIERKPTGILLTDTELKLWQKSNPKAYAEWFYDRMKVIFLQRRAAFAKSIQANIEEVPTWQVKTPLQTAVQILKRHRDIYFQDKQDVKPVSIIITTLAALSYENQPSVYDALIGIIQKIEANWGKKGFVEYRNGKWWVANPVDDDENFADKWNEYPARRESFLAWLKKVQRDLNAAMTSRNFNESAEILAPVLGRSTIARVAQNLGRPISSTALVPITETIKVPALGDTRHCQPSQWSEKITYKANISASVHLKQYNTKKKLWDLTVRPVPKNIWLRFLVKTNVPQPYDVRWQVVNTGQEALEANQLRGDFYNSNTSNNNCVRWEHTSYMGTHWVEAFIIQKGVCVARSGRKLVKIR